MSDYPIIHWIEAGAEQSAIWLSANASPPPKRIIIADDTIKADDAYRLACEGTALLWRSDFHNAKQLLQAIARRIDAKTKTRTSKTASKGNATSPLQSPIHYPLLNPLPLAGEEANESLRELNFKEAFHQNRQTQAQRANILGMVLIPFNPDHTIPLRRAPDVQQACIEAYGETNAPYISSLRELQGIIGAHE